jgi:hypothetical protein
VQVDDAVDRRIAAVLALHVLQDRPDVVAEVLAPGGLDAGEDDHGRRAAYRDPLAFPRESRLAGSPAHPNVVTQSGPFDARRPARFG